ncbi:hypothetical protein E7T09_08630 [Deinococcus sp. KSM4-11]|uniref:SIS domain-containing protein n=1 Tax=Deinococcus sp. KSM4-11 TaxID=2568654 RepID=UPI0010A3C1FA|nr:hypothetical protein [Deinococcus sp. KSM4-11]THF87209.1 hypothetical protein E7T09_08630 [Deinococcus sp. KSM4-11]
MTHTTHPGLSLLRAERARQWTDAQATLGDPEPRRLAGQVADALRAPGASLLLLGMGGSHHANQTAISAYRQRGLHATAMTLDEALVQPLPADLRRVSVIVSQSGESGEIVRYLEAQTLPASIFGASLNAGSELARRVPTLIAAGGPEVAFAATRSFVLTLTLHQVILEALGAERLSLDALIPVPDVDAAPLRDVTSVVFLGAGSASGLAHMAGLGTLELARFPALSYEAGQFRHGPPELLSPQVGTVLITSSAPDTYRQATMARILDVCAGAGSPTLQFTADQGSAANLSGELALCPAIQQLVIDLALQRVPNVGDPVRSAKVTR